MSDITRIFEALYRLGLVGERPYSETMTISVTNQHHVTLTLRSEKAITTFMHALEAAVPGE